MVTPGTEPHDCPTVQPGTSPARRVGRVVVVVVVDVDVVLGDVEVVARVPVVEVEMTTSS
jgi:hypothetical protein